MELLPVSEFHKKHCCISAVESCLFVKTFVMYRERWQWAQGLPSAEHGFSAGYFKSIFIECEDSVMRSIEKKRSQGSKVWILECPAILLKFDGFALVVTFTRNCDGAMQDSLEVKNFPASLHSLLQFGLKKHSIEIRALPEKLGDEVELSDVSLLRRYTPSPSGYKGQVNWSIDYEKINLDAFKEVFEVIRVALRENV